MTKIDEPAEIREGEELDPKIIDEFLKDNISSLRGDISIRQFPKGFSNLTYLVTFENKELVLRRPPSGKKTKTAHDMSREFRMLSALKPLFPYCPTPLIYCDDLSVMNTPFYVMERLKGIILRKNLPEKMELSSTDARELSENMIKVLCKLHSLDYKKAGLEDFGKPSGYVLRQVEGWSRRYRDSRTDDAPDFEDVMQWLHDNKPGESGLISIIHNDYKLDNIVLNPEEPLNITGILDWEMATVGDPLMDLGSSLAYWVQNDDPDNMQLIRTMPTNIDGMLTRDEQVKLYGEIMGIDIINFDFFYCFGLFKLAVIAQQIYYRYYHGQTKDERFKMLIFAVKILEERARMVMA